MPQIDEITLKKQIKSGELSRVYMIFGEDSYLKQYYASAVEKTAVADVLPEMNSSRIDGKGLKMQTLADELEQLPVMNRYRCVFVSDYDITGRTDADIDLMKKLISDIPESTVLVLYLSTVEINMKKQGKWSGIIRAAAAAGEVLNFEYKTDAAIAKILCDSANRRKCLLDTSTAKMIINLCGKDMKRLQGELDKLCAYKKDEGAILPADVELMCAKTAEGNKYVLFRAIISENVPRSLDIIADLLDSRMDPIEILGSIVSGYVDIYRMKAALSSGKTVQDAAADFGYGKGRTFVLENAAPFAKKMSNEVLRRCLDRLDEADTQLKQSALDSRLILERLVILLVETERNRAI